MDEIWKRGKQLGAFLWDNCFQRRTTNLLPQLAYFTAPDGPDSAICEYFALRFSISEALAIKYS
jgi:hypothetical protein